MRNKTKAIEADLGIFSRIEAYSGICMFRNYSEFSGTFGILCNRSILGTLVYSKSETEAYSEPYQTATMEHFSKILNNYTVAVFTN